MPALHMPTTEGSTASLHLSSTEPDAPGPVTWEALRELQDALHAHGGLVMAERAMWLKRPSAAAPTLSQIARWIVEGDVLSLEVYGSHWLPICQFEPDEWRVRPAMVALMREWMPPLDTLSLLQWLARPNEGTDHLAPVALLDTAPERVLATARCDRFALYG